MLTIAPLASPDYYLGSAATSGEAFNYFSEVEASAGSAPAIDPLQRTGRWLGQLSQELGLEPGSMVRAEAFEAIYFGLNPETGQPLRKDGKSKRSQMKDAKHRDQCLQARTQALARLNGARGAAADDGHAASLEHLKQSQAAFLAADAAYRSAQQKSMRPGSDLVFSAPKSVSMQWAALLSTGDTAGASYLEHAHEQAVRDTFAKIQSQFVMTRKRGENSERILEAVQGVIACQWRHFDARPTARAGGACLPDPHLHDHINLFAPVRGADGDIYAAYTDYIRHNLKGLGAMYRARLAHNLASCGYSIERDAQDQGLFFALSGVGREQAKASSARTADIEALEAKGLDSAQAKLYSRKAKNKLAGFDILESWKTVFADLGMDPQQVKHASLGDSVALDAHWRNVPAEESEAFARQAVRDRLPGVRTDAALLHTLLEKEAYFSLSDIRQFLWEDAQFSAGQEADLDAYVERRLRKLLRSPDLLQVMDPAPSLADQKSLNAKHASPPARPLAGLNRYGEPVFTTHALRQRETALLGQTIPKLLHGRGYGVDVRVATDVIQQLEAQLSEERISRGEQAFALRDFQVAAVLQAVCGDSQLCVQIAGAGMGKTTSAQFSKEIWQAQGRKLIGVAPSNKAASGLGRELGIPTSSLDRLLIDLDAGRTTLDRDSVVLVDEAGMASFDGLERLMTLAARSGAKLVLMGDPEQLPAVARGNVLRKLSQMKEVANTPNALLYLGKNLSDWDRISRQKDDWAKQASMFFSQGLVAEGLRAYEERGCVHAALTPEHMQEGLAQAYLDDPAAPKNKMVLATTHAQVNAANLVIRSALKEQGKLQGNWLLPNCTLEISLGDRIVFKQGVKAKSRPQRRRRKGDAAKNVEASPSVAVAKNEFATVRGVTRQSDGSLELLCELDVPQKDGKLTMIKVNTREIGELDHAFATTVHRSQGMTVDAVYAVAGSFLSKELFYVMATRHRARFHLHLLEQDRQLVLQQAAKPIPKLHALDLDNMAGMQRAGGAASSAILERIRGGLEALGIWMRAEMGRFSEVMHLHDAAQQTGALPLLPSKGEPVRKRLQALLSSVKTRHSLSGQQNLAPPLSVAGVKSQRESMKAQPELGR